MNSSVWFSAFLTVMVLFQIVAIPALVMRKNDLADVLWGPAFPITVFIAVMSSQLSFDALGLRAQLILLLLTVWAIRLFFHVGLRNLSTKEEDVRYGNWRKAWGQTWMWRSYLQVFVLQPVILYVFLTSSLLAVSTSAESMSVLAWLGVGVWIVGFVFESVGDEQLRRFKADKANKGKLMTSGLWSWTRHPNYFGEITLWWGIWLMVVDLPYGYLTVISPIGVTLLILKVSGVSMLEDLMRTRPGFAEYAAKTPRFFPRPPRRS